MLEQKQPSSTGRDTLKVTLLGSEWGSSAGGLSTFNRELAIHLSEHPEVDVSVLVPEGQCTEEDKRDAQSHDITFIEAEKRSECKDPLYWVSFPPRGLRIDVIIGHGAKLGWQGQDIKGKSKNASCKLIQVVHTAPEDLSKYKTYSEPTSKGEEKHQAEVDLCERADLVVPVGPRLGEAYSSYLRGCKKDQDISVFTPGLFEREFGDVKQSLREMPIFKVLKRNKS